MNKRYDHIIISVFSIIVNFPEHFAYFSKESSSIIWNIFLALFGSTAVTVTITFTMYIFIGIIGKIDVFLKKILNIEEKSIIKEDKLFEHAFLMTLLFGIVQLIILLSGNNYSLFYLVLGF